MHGDLPSIVPRRNYDIRTQCLKGTCSSSELPGRWHVPVLDDACPCRGCSSMFSPEASTWKGRLQVPLLDQIHCFGFPDRADDGVRPRGFLLGKQACYHCTTSAWPCFFRIRRTAVTCCPPAERGMAGFRVNVRGLHAGWGLDACVRQRSSTLLASGHGCVDSAGRRCRSYCPGILPPG